MTLSVCYVFPSHTCAADDKPASSPEFGDTHIDDEEGSTMGSGDTHIDDEGGSTMGSGDTHIDDEGGSTMGSGSGDVRPPPDPPGVHVCMCVCV